MNTDDIGTRIGQLRSKRGMTQKALAEASGVRLDIIKKVECGERPLSKIDYLMDIASALEVNPCYLLTGNSDENRHCAADELGLSDGTVTRIRYLNRNDKPTLRKLEMIIDDDGTPACNKNPPEESFVSILSHFMCNGTATRTIDPDTGLQAPHKYVLQLQDGSWIHPQELNPRDYYMNKMILRLITIRAKYLKSMPNNLPPDEEDEHDEES